jgi:hypothetical protein
MGEPKTGSGDQNHDHEAVFDVAAGLQCVVPEVKSLRNMAAKTNQEKQKRTELKKGRRTLLFDAICRLGVRKTHVARPNIPLLDA